MTLFLISLAVLIGGYFLYGLFVERVFSIDPGARPLRRLIPTVSITYLSPRGKYSSYSS